jgi:drug/metabolite transporter (DMT)-like permease
MSRPAESDTARTAPVFIWAALGAVYVCWGMTYLAIRVANRTLPPLMAASVRFLVAGVLLYAWAIRRGDREGDRPTRTHWRSAAIVGGFLLLGGNGGVVWAERTIPSGITALLVATVPLWIALFDRIIFKQRQRPQVTLGLVAGFGGAALLVGASARGHVDLTGMLFVVGASMAWATGSLYGRTAPLPRRPLVGVAMEMLCGGVFLAVGAIATGELGQFHWSKFSSASLLGLAYLITGGSWVGFASFAWLLRNARTSLVFTYAYVNPVVAVFLGWLILGERVTARSFVAGGIIVAAVALIISAGGARREDGSAVEGSDERGPSGEAELALEGVRRAEQDRLAEHLRGELESDG